MTVEELFELHDELTTRAKKIMEGKNHDYGQQHRDPFANFRGAKFIGLDEEKGLLLRVMDKIQRQNAFIEKGILLVKNEGIEDTCIDIINYQVLLLGLIREKKSKVININDLQT
jgi:hypothetical protein